MTPSHSEAGSAPAGPLSPRQMLALQCSRRAALVRKRTSPDAESDEQLCPQQRYTKRPKHPGMIAFNPSLRELPLQKSKTKKRSPPPPASQASETQETCVTSKTKHSDSQYNECSSDGTVGPSPEALQEQSTTPQGTPTQEQYHTAALPASMLTTTLPNQIHSLAMGTLPHEPYGVAVPHRQQLEQTLQEASIQLSEAYIHWPYLETKLIYADLVGPNPTYINGVAQPVVGYNSETLGSLRRNVLDTSSDFFQISQNPHAPHALRRLAFAYGMPHKYARSGLKTWLPILEATLDAVQDKMLSFIDRARSLLDTLDTKFRYLRDDWKDMNESLHHYLHVLMNAGLNSYCIYKCELFLCSPRWRAWESNKHAPENPLDQEFRERHFQQFLPLPVPDAAEVDRRYSSTVLPLKASVLCVLSGWLCYGPKIARDFHEFCKVFKFLAWVGATF